MNYKNNTVLEKHSHHKLIINWEENNGNNYHSARKLMNLLFEKKILQDVIFQIEESYVTCTVNFEPKTLEISKYFLQDALLYQSRGTGKTEQAAFFQALAKIHCLEG